MGRPKLIFSLTLLVFLIPAVSLAGELYKWVDEDGVVHVTDDPEKVPKGHIGSVKELPPNHKVDILPANLEEIWAGIKARKNMIAIGMAGLIAVSILYKSLLYAKPKLLEGRRRKRLKALEQSGIDHLDLAEFKQYIETLLTDRGFSLKKPDSPLDLGVDLIAERDKVKYAVLIKHLSSPVSRTVVNDLEREKHRYGCTNSMIITTDYFYDDLTESARSVDCVLIDREKLGEWILGFERR